MQNTEQTVRLQLGEVGIRFANQQFVSLQDVEQEWDGERKEGEMMSKEKKEEMPKEGEDIYAKGRFFLSASEHVLVVLTFDRLMLTGCIYHHPHHRHNKIIITNQNHQR